MKKAEKEIKIRTAAKVRIAEIEMKIAGVRSDNARNRAEILKDYALRLQGVTDENRRNDIVAARRAALAAAEASLRAEIAQLKYELHKTRKECGERCAEAQDDPEPEKSEPAKAVWVNGEQRTCAVVARRVLDKLPVLNHPQESFVTDISKSHDGTHYIDFRYVNTIDKASGIAACELKSGMTDDEQAAAVDFWLKKVDVMMKEAKEIKEGEEADNE